MSVAASRPDEKRGVPGPAAVPVARAIARQALALGLADLPWAVVEKTKLLLLDFLACAFEAAPLPWSRQALAAVATGNGDAPVLGTALRAAPESAAFVNAVMGHGLVREDMHPASVSHHGIVVWPTLLALAAEKRVSGADVLAAAVVGYEVGARLGRQLFDGGLSALYRPTGVVAPIGAAMAGSRLLALRESEAAAAMALAANTSSGLNQWPQHGGSEMYFHPGFAARNAVTAVALAAAGAFASEDIIEGRAGLFAAFRRSPPAAPIALFADGGFEVSAVYAKPAPACNFAQTACQAALAVTEHLSAAADAITGIVISLPEAAYRYPGCSAVGPFSNALQAKMSIAFSVAAVLARGAIAEANYQHIDDAEILRLVGITEMRVDPAFTAAFPVAQGAEVEVTLANGSRVGRSLPDVVGATAADVRRRFAAVAEARLGRDAAEAIEDFVDRLETADDAGRLAALALGAA